MAPLTKVVGAIAFGDIDGIYEMASEYVRSDQLASVDKMGGAK